MVIGPPDGFVELLRQVLDGVVETLNLVLADQANARLGIWQRQAFPIIDDPATDAGDIAEPGIGRVQQLLRRRQVVLFDSEWLRGLRSLIGCESFAHAQPSETDPHRGECCLELSRGGDGAALRRMMAFIGMMPLGSLGAGFLAETRVGTQWTVVIGGALCLVAAGIFALRLPGIRREVRPIYVKKGIMTEAAAGLAATDALMEGARE